MKKIFFIILSIALAFVSQSQCTTVNNDGSVTIVFGEVPDAVVERYDNDGWMEAGRLQNGEYTDKNVNGGQKNILYRIVSEDSDKPFSTLLCTANVNSDDNSKVDIVWTWLYGTLTEEVEFSEFKIYRKTVDDDDFVFLVSLASNQVSYVDQRVNDCEIQYKIEGVKNDCSSWSNIGVTSKEDNDGPLTPVLHSIDVDLQTQNILINWDKSLSDDVRGYVVCKLNYNGIRQPLDTLYGENNTTYICYKCNVTDTNRITVFAFDYCRNTSPLSETYNNIVLKVDREDCNEPLHLSWNTPDDAAGLKNYDIYMSDGNNGQYEKIGGTTQLSYDVSLEQTSNKVSFYVVYNDGKSNTVTVNISGTDTLDFVYLEGVSITEDNFHADIYAFVDAGKKVKGYKLYRKIDNEPFEIVKDIDFTGKSYLKFTDELPLSANEHDYTYYLAAPDLCGGNYTYSNQLTAMRLEVDASNSSRIKLSWNPFKPVNWNVEGYEVYRFAEKDFENAEYIGKTFANSYTDDVENIVSSTDRTYYYVKAVTSTSDNTDINAFGINSSNNYAKFESILFVPNAFAPKDGVHDNIRTFKPACHFVRSGTYSFKVFSRAGEVLFETNDPDKGWDGKYKGEYCPVGTYVYKISFIDSDGMEQNKGGAFLLYD